MITKTQLNQVGRAVVQECLNAGITDAEDISDMSIRLVRKMTVMGVAGFKAGISRTRNSRRHARRR